MAELLTLSVRPRAEKGKGPCRRLRTKDQVPGIYYNKEGQNIPVLVDMLPLTRLHGQVGNSRVFHLKIDQEGAPAALPALIKEVQYDPLKSKPIHVDFYGVDLKRNIKVDVPVEVSGKAKGIVLGGLLEIFRDALEVECKPLEVPEKIVIDVTDLDIGDNVHVQSIKMPKGVRILFEENFAVVGVVAPEAEEVEAETEEAAAPAEGAAAEGEAAEGATAEGAAAAPAGKGGAASGKAPAGKAASAKAPAGKAAGGKASGGKGGSGKGSSK